MNAHKVNTRLNLLGIPTLRVVISDEPTLEDDCIDVTENISVQVGGDYLIATVDNDDDTFTMHPQVRSATKLAEQLKDLLS